MLLRHSKSILDFDYNRTTSEQTIYYNILSLNALHAQILQGAFKNIFTGKLKLKEKI